MFRRHINLARYLEKTQPVIWAPVSGLCHSIKVQFLRFSIINTVEEKCKYPIASDLIDAEALTFNTSTDTYLSESSTSLLSIAELTLALNS